MRMLVWRKTIPLYVGGNRGTVDIYFGICTLSRNPVYREEGVINVQRDIT